MSTIALDTEPMVWRLTWRSPEGDKPVEISMRLTSVVDGAWKGEVRVTGYPALVTVFPITGCDWVQAHQMMGSQAQIFLLSYAKSGPLYWPGTDIEFVYPAWRRRGPHLLDRLRVWWILRQRPAPE